MKISGTGPLVAYWIFNKHHGSDAVSSEPSIARPPSPQARQRVGARGMAENGITCAVSLVSPERGSPLGLNVLTTIQSYYLVARPGVPKPDQ